MMNIYDILILFAVSAVFVFAVLRMISNRKKGKICGGNCSCCNTCSTCGRKNEEK